VKPPTPLPPTHESLSCGIEVRAAAPGVEKISPLRRMGARRVTNEDVTAARRRRDGTPIAPDAQEGHEQT